MDDFVIPLVAKVRHGCGLVYDAEAVAREETAPDVAGEFRRRVRIGAGGFQSIAMLWRLMNPRRGWVAAAFVSHKLMRWLCPFTLLGIFLCNAAVLGVPAFRWMMAGQVLFYAAAAIGSWVPGGGAAVKLLRVAHDVHRDERCVVAGVRPLARFDSHRHVAAGHSAPNRRTWSP